MRFTPTALLLAAAAAAPLATARGLPRANEMLDVDGGVFRRANCETTPSAPKGPAAPKPVGAPAAATAAECQARCAADAACQSFVFGVTAGGGGGEEDDDGVECLLYGVAVSEIPTQLDVDLRAYDKACTGVPDEL